MKFHINVLAFYLLLTLLATGNLAEIPNPPVNLNVVDVGPGFVKLSWTPVPGDNIDFYKLQYRQKEDISSIFSEKRMREPSHKVRRLTPFTNYEFQVIAVNSVGESRPTNIVEKRTSSLDKGATYEFRVQAVNENGDGHRAVKTLDIPDGVPAGAPQNFTATGVSETTIHLKWELPVKHQQNGEIVMYQMKYHKLGEIDVDDLNLTSTEFTIRGLDWNTDYVFQIRAFTKKGAGPWSSTLIFKIYEGIIPAPQQVVVRRTSWKTIQVTWNEPEVPVSGYRVSYNKFYVENFESWPSFDIGPYTVADITGLEKQPYAIRVSAKSLDGKFGNASAAVIANVPTRLERDDIVTIFRVTHRTSTTINLAWEPPKQIGINNYLLEIVGMKFQRLKGQISPQNLSPILPINIPGQSTTWIVPNLVPKARYKFIITSLFRNGKKGPEQYLMAETRLEAPREVKRPEIEKIEKGHIVFRLTAASEVNGRISHYYLIVVPILNSTILRRPQDYQFDEFDDSPHPSVFARKPYIAAKFSSHRLPWLFILGACDEYEGFTNRPLNKDWRYRVFLRAHTVEQDLYTTSYYSAPISLGPYIRQLPRPIAPSPGDTDTVDQASPNVPNSKSVMIIVSVVPVCAGVTLIIIGCILLIWYMRRKSHRKSKTPEQIPGKVCVDVPPRPSDLVE
ncbi:tyrosine-protein phosphatase Lar-like [Mytilus trossulus]|uniref:tyrosine-protein phosphatase Lar-like n=1 Tax=Mytilus trossulus TaxID=6551 RepID=UPI003007EC61